MAKLRLSLPSFSVEPRVDVVHERDLRIRVWISQNVSRKWYELPLKPSAATSQLQAATYDFEVRTDAGDVFYEPDPLPMEERIRHSNLNIDLWSVMRNKNNESCLNQSGSVRIPLHQLMRDDGKRVFQFTIPSWGDPNAHGENHDPEIINDKGTITFSDRATIGINGLSIEPLSDDAIRLHDRVQEVKDATMFGYMRACVQMFRRLGYTWATIRDVNAYVYACRGGLFPAAAYLGAHPGGSSETYFLHAARLVFARDSTLPPLELFDWEHDVRAPGLLGRILTLSANMLVYVPDVVYFPSAKTGMRYLRRPLESFDYARARGGGDCEDVALEVELCGAELLALEAKGSALSPIVRGMIALRKRYVICMCLGGVSSAEINGDYGLAKGMGAHMWALAIPRSMFARWWADGNLSPERAARLNLIDTREDTLPLLVLEGTGYLRPEGSESRASPDPEALALRILESHPGRALEGARHWYNYRRDKQSSFYKTGSILFTNEFLRIPDRPNDKIAAFAICQRATRTTGATFQDIVSGSRSLCLVSEPGMNAVEIACIRDGMKDMFPIPPLRAPEESMQSDAPEANRLYTARLVQRISSEVGALSGTRSIDASRAFTLDENDGLVPRVRPIRVEYFLKESLLDESRAQRLIDTCRDIGSDLVADVECVRERLTPELASWRIVLLCKPIGVDKARAMLARLAQQRAAQSLSATPPIRSDYEDDAPAEGTDFDE